MVPGNMKNNCLQLWLSELLTEWCRETWTSRLRRPEIIHLSPNGPSYIMNTPFVATIPSTAGRHPRQ